MLYDRLTTTAKKGVGRFVDATAWNRLNVIRSGFNGNKTRLYAQIINTGRALCTVCYFMNRTGTRTDWIKNNWIGSLFVWNYQNRSNIFSNKLLLQKKKKILFSLVIGLNRIGPFWITEWSDRREKTVQQWIIWGVVIGGSQSSLRFLHLGYRLLVWFICLLVLCFIFLLLCQLV